MAKLYLLLGGLSAGLAVLFGAFGAHALKMRLDEAMMQTYQVAVQYHFYHALGILIIAVVMLNFPQSILLKWSAGLMCLGLLLFSGSLYVLSLTGIRWLGIITPIGGMAFILAWLLFAIAIWRVS